MLVRRYTQVLALFLFVTGVQGLFLDTVYELFTTNIAHGVIEIALAGVGYRWCLRGVPRATYLMVVGGILMAVGGLRLLPGTDAVMIALLRVNEALAFFNLVLGAATVIVGVVDRRILLSHRPVRSDPVLISLANLKG